MNAAEPRRHPQTLADVQAGDEVVLLGWLGYSRHRVKRTTAALIVLESGASFRRKNGAECTCRSSSIAVGPKAAARVAEIDRFAEVRREAAADAEAALRELGEQRDA